MVEVGSLVPQGIQRRELLDVHDPSVPAKTDQLQVVTSETGADQVVQREGGPLHRHPAAVHRHREGRVREQGDRGTRPRLGLRDLHITDVQTNSLVPYAAGLATARYVALGATVL